MGWESLEWIILALYCFHVGFVEGLRVLGLTCVVPLLVPRHFQGTHWALRNNVTSQKTLILAVMDLKGAIKLRKISWLPEDMLASQRGLCCVELRSLRVKCSGVDLYIYICVCVCVCVCVKTAVGMPPGGSSTVHIYTQTIHRTTQKVLEECGPCPVLASYTLAFALQVKKKHGETSVRVGEECQQARCRYINIQ